MIPMEKKRRLSCATLSSVRRSSVLPIGLRSIRRWPVDLTTTPGRFSRPKPTSKKFGTTLSFAGGGRYDDLIGLYGGKRKARSVFVWCRAPDRSAQRAGGWPASDGATCAGGAAWCWPNCRCRAGGDDATSGRNCNAILLSATAPGKHLQYAESVSIDRVIFVGEDEVETGSISV